MATKPAEAEVRDKLARLHVLKTELDTFDTQLGKLVPKVEETLGSLRLGIPISLEIGIEEDDARQYLSFTKVGKQWRLCVEWIGGPAEDHTTTPLSDVSRTERANILQWHLPNMLEGAVDEMEKSIKQRQKAIDSTKHFIDTVSKIRDDEPAAGVFSSNTVTQMNSPSQVGMKVSVNMPKEAYDAIALPLEKRTGGAKFPPRRLIIGGKKRETIMDNEKPESIADDGEDE